MDAHENGQRRDVRAAQDLICEHACDAAAAEQEHIALKLDAGGGKRFAKADAVGRVADEAAVFDLDGVDALKRLGVPLDGVEQRQDGRLIGHRDIKSRKL